MWFIPFPAEIKKKPPWSMGGHLDHFEKRLSHGGRLTGCPIFTILKGQIQAETPGNFRDHIDKQPWHSYFYK
jgi:hypothetical protein